MTTFDERDMENIFAPLQNTVAPATLRDRAIDAAGAASRAKAPKRYVFGIVAVAALAATAMITMLPRKAGAEILFDNMIRAIQGVDRVHFQTYFNARGGWQKDQEAWYDNGNWRIVTPRDQLLLAGDTKWTYASGQDTALRTARQPGEQPPGMENGLGMSAGLEQMRRMGFHIQLEPGTKQVVDGRTVQRFVATREGHNERDIFEVDTATDLPLNIEHDILTKTGWQIQMKMRCEYNAPTPAGIFDPSFGNGVKVVDLDGLRQEWIKKLARPIQTVPVGPETVEIRDVFVSRQGWVYMLWTGKIGGNDYRLDLKDDAGNVYSRAYFNPGAIPGSQSKLPLLSVDGQVVDGAWFVPVNPMEARGTHRYTLHADKLTVSGTDPIHTGRWFRRAWEPEVSEMYDHPQFTVTPLGDATVSGTATSVDLPSYLPLFQDNPPTMRYAKIWENDARLWHWVAKLGPDFKISNTVYRDSPAPVIAGTPAGPNIQIAIPGANLEPGKYDPTILRQLLALRQESIRLDSDLDPSGQGSGFDWYEIYELQRALGNPREAEEAIRMAERIRPEIKWR